MSRLRNRMVKATFWTDGELLRWPRDKRHAYQSLWAMAEDSCCIEDDPFEWKLTAWASPMDSDITVEKLTSWRDEWVDAGKVIRYSNGGGKTYLYLPQMGEHEKPRNPQSPDLPTPPCVVYTVHGEGKSRTVKYTHGYRECSVQNGCGTRNGSPALYCPVLPCPDLPEDKRSLSPTLDLKGIHPGAFGKLWEKIGREPSASELKSLRSLCKHYSDAACCFAISQAYVQINEGSSSPDDPFALITTIAKREAAS